MYIMIYEIKLALTSYTFGVEGKTYVFKFVIFYWLIFTSVLFGDIYFIFIDIIQIKVLNITNIFACIIRAIPLE